MQQSPVEMSWLMGVFQGSQRVDPQGGHGGDAGNEDFQPRIIPYNKDLNKSHKKVFRLAVEKNGERFSKCGSPLECLAQHPRVEVLPLPKIGD
ncbi:hypothetical protein AAFF_G00001930 [Aldrovandia affinis]|uniref:Uncharacterized protein n=1 Tax=Aldrovandia affinis TaxID=143900 RepID=A0AAD7X4N5_9TELE|nr:hypothetical protein AAFF_G00001930 [Aldrovandia affinis]